MSIFNVYASLMVSNNIQNQIFKIQKKIPNPIVTQKYTVSVVTFQQKFQK